MAFHPRPVRPGAAGGLGCDFNATDGWTHAGHSGAGAAAGGFSLRTGTFNVTYNFINYGFIWFYHVLYGFMIDIS